MPFRQGLIGASSKCWSALPLPSRRNFWLLRAPRPGAPTGREMSGFREVFPYRETLRWNEAFVGKFLDRLSSTNSWQWAGFQQKACSLQPQQPLPGTTRSLMRAPGATLPHSLEILMWMRTAWNLMLRL